MKKLKYLALIAGMLVAGNLSAKAFTLDPCLTFVTAVGFNTIAQGNSPTANLDVLNSVNGTSFTLADFPNLGNFEAESADLSVALPVTAGSYVVVHYGTGKGGTNKGGSLEIFLVNAGCTSATFPQSGNVGGADAFGHGGISSVRVFNNNPPPPTVPDSGTTVMLLGSGLAGLGLARRYLKR